MPQIRYIVFVTRLNYANDESESKMRFITSIILSVMIGVATLHVAASVSADTGFFVVNDPQAEFFYQEDGIPIDFGKIPVGTEIQVVSVKDEKCFFTYRGKSACILRQFLISKQDYRAHPQPVPSRSEAVPKPIAVKPHVPEQPVQSRVQNQQDSPQLATELVKLGDAKMNERNLDGAIADYSKAVELDPRLANAYNSRGLAERYKGKWDDAIADHSKALELDPQLASAYNNRGYAKQGKGDLAGASADYSQAIAINPAFCVAYNNRGNLKKDQGDLDGAIADYTKNIECDSKYAPAYNNRGKAEMAKGDLDGAITDFTKAIELHPKYTDAYKNRGKAKKEKGDSGRRG